LAREKTKEEIMRKSMAVFIALAVLAAGGAAWAATTTVAVSANVVGTCQVTNTNGAPLVAFGQLDQVGAPLVDGAVTQPTFWCTKNTTYTIGDDLGANDSAGVYRMTNGTDFIAYTFTYTGSAPGTGRTTPITMDISASIPAGTYSDVSAGSYADSVLLTISP
jgi:spore coat protein U-like protein